MIRLPFSNKLVWLIFFVAVFVRMLYFPNNVYFAYDQARDAFTAQEILKGDIKLIGPPSAASDKLFPGPLIYYIYAPIYFLFGKNPEAVAVALRVINALGVFPVFAIGSLLFNKRVGLLAAFLFAFSYEQTQYSLFISHQPIAVISVLAFYLGLTLFIFKRKEGGLLLAAAGWGLSIQFHYLYLLLAIPLVLVILALRKKIYSPRPMTLVVSAGILLLTVSTYIVSELKFNLRASKALFQTTQNVSSAIHPESISFIANRFVHDNLVATSTLLPIVWLLVGAALIYLIKQHNSSDKAKFLTIWFWGGFPVYVLTGTPSYYYSAAASVPLLLLASWVSTVLTKSRKFIGLLLPVLIIASNLSLIHAQNPLGPNSDIVIQPGMLLSDQKAALDHIYSNANGKPFAVRSLTIPFNINTTWSYLFEWYGQQKYNYLPVWIGPTAKGYPGNIHVVDDRSRVPELQFLIMEPTKGLHVHTIDDFFREEGYFTQVVEQKSFGTITVEWRRRI